MIEDFKKGDRVLIEGFSPFSRFRPGVGTILFITEDRKWVRISVRYPHCRNEKIRSFPINLLMPAKNPEINESSKSKKAKRDLTEREKYAAQCLAECRFLPASFDKRFAREFSGSSQGTGRQVQTLWRMIYRYRRQIQDMELIEEARRINGALPKTASGAKKENSG